MLAESIFIGFLTIEVIVLLVFVVYTVKYIRQSREAVDPYTKWTLTLLCCSMTFQVCRIPIIVMTMVYSGSGNNYDNWYENNVQSIGDIETAIIFFHANL